MVAGDERCTLARPCSRGRSGCGGYNVYSGGIWSMQVMGISTSGATANITGGFGGTTCRLYAVVLSSRHTGSAVGPPHHARRHGHGGPLGQIQYEPEALDHMRPCLCRLNMPSCRLVTVEDTLQNYVDIVCVTCQNPAIEWSMLPRVGRPDILHKYKSGAGPQHTQHGVSNKITGDFPLSSCFLKLPLHHETPYSSRVFPPGALRSSPAGPRQAHRS